MIKKGLGSRVSHIKLFFFFFLFYRDVMYDVSNVMYYYYYLILGQTKFGYKFGYSLML